MKKSIQLFTVLALIAWSQLIQAQITPAPDRKEGQGPYTQLIIRGVTLINGTGAPPFGPVDIVIEKNRIQRIITVGAEGNPIQSSRRPVLAAGGKEIDASGMYALPGFIDMHAHIGGKEQDSPVADFQVNFEDQISKYFQNNIQSPLEEIKNLSVDDIHPKESLFRRYKRT
mgnify:CR=1 FL=1